MLHDIGKSQKEFEILVKHLHHGLYIGVIAISFLYQGSLALLYKMATNTFNEQEHE